MVSTKRFFIHKSVFIFNLTLMKLIISGYADLPFRWDSQKQHISDCLQNILFLRFVMRCTCNTVAWILTMDLPVTQVADNHPRL